jgi:hypothetical protein
MVRGGAAVVTYVVAEVSMARGLADCEMGTHLPRLTPFRKTLLFLRPCKSFALCRAHDSGIMFFEHFF